MRKREAAHTALAVLRRNPNLNIETPTQQDNLYDQLYDALWPVDGPAAANDPYLEQMSIEHLLRSNDHGVSDLCLTLSEQRRGFNSQTIITYRRRRHNGTWELLDIGPEPD